jgi:hypothetical protein
VTTSTLPVRAAVISTGSPACVFALASRAGREQRVHRLDAAVGGRQREWLMP